MEYAFEKIVADFPLVSYGAGETVLSDGAKSGQLLILKQGAVAILKDSVEIARVEEPGAVFGEIAALLDQPHSADVKALQTSQFYVTDTDLRNKDPVVLFQVATILARRIVTANTKLIELKKQIGAGQSQSILSKMLVNIEKVLSVGGASFET
jgi:CRP/FNR family transcriptional regulator, cyclic AMP receptor protein